MSKEIRPNREDDHVAPSATSTSRRAVLKGIGAAGLASLASAVVKFEPEALASVRDDETYSANSSGRRRNRSFEIRVEQATAEKRVRIPAHPDNGDEDRYSNRIGNFSKGLPHDALGEVDAHAYSKMIKAFERGAAADFEQIPLGGSVRLVDPQAGLAFDLEGTDSHQLAIPPSPALASAQRADEMVELYWQAVLRDLPFSRYESDAGAQAAASELSRLSDFRGPRDSHGNVTPATLFRGFTGGDLVGPYVSQFLFPTLQYGAAEIVQQFQTYLPGIDYLTDFPSWLRCQNGLAPFGSNQIDPTRRYIRCGRDLAAYVHVDVLFEAYLNACLYLIDIGAPLNPGNPYLASNNQTGFGTFGAPHVKTLLAEVSTRALKAVWFQKWFVHRALRPEAYGGLVQLTISGTKSYPVHADVVNSQAVREAYSRNGTYLLPIAVPEGCPQHPSYGAGHATVAGACATIVKAFFDETWQVPNPVMPSDDGLSLLPYTGADAALITLGGEMNKIAANIAIGRNHMGVHWRSDYQESVKLGEAIAISVLRDQRPTYNEDFAGFTFTRFDGTKITV